MRKFSNKEKKVISIACAAWGIVLISSGTIMNAMAVPEQVTMTDPQIIQKRITDNKTNEIKLKDIEIEINEPLSVNAKDYLENADDIDMEVIKKLKLDISAVNIAEAGTYKYTIVYNKKKYVGNCKVKEKELPKVELTLKNLKLVRGSAISTDITTYIEEDLTDEVKNNIVLDLSKISTSEAGVYQYTVTYDNKLYTGTIEVYEPQIKVITPNQSAEEEPTIPDNPGTGNNNDNTGNDNGNNNDSGTGDDTDNKE